MTRTLTAYKYPPRCAQVWRDVHSRLWCVLDVACEEVERFNTWHAAQAYARMIVAAHRTVPA